jgi:peptidoglycan/LPS O-acetylase OafA/YrhL
MPELDALRGLAALVIMMFHLRFMGRHPRWGSGLDIDVFFVLSGYLITTSILHTLRARNFYQVFYFRRALRIWPIYYLVMLACVLVNPLLPRPDALKDSGYYITFTQHVSEYWSGPTTYFSRFFQHTWTLAIEEQFYLFWPLLVRLLGRRRLWIAFAPLLIVPVAMRCRGFQEHTLLTHCDSLTLGAILAVMLDGPERFARRAAGGRWAFGLLGLAMFSAPLWRDAALAPLQRAWPGLPWFNIVPSLELFRVGLADFALVGFVICSTGRAWVGFLRLPALRYVGRTSYSLYMYHPIVFGIVALAHRALGFRGSVWMDIVKAIACLGVGALSWHYFERPILALKDRFPYRDDADTPPPDRSRRPIPGPHFAAPGPEATEGQQPEADVQTAT